eukprot:2817358-Amphidinium_carterae.1
MGARDQVIPGSRGMLGIASDSPQCEDEAYGSNSSASIFAQLGVAASKWTISHDGLVGMEFSSRLAPGLQMRTRLERR